MCTIAISRSSVASKVSIGYTKQIAILFSSGVVVVSPSPIYFSLFSTFHPRTSTLVSHMDSTAVRCPDCLVFTVDWSISKEV